MALKSICARMVIPVASPLVTCKFPSYICISLSLSLSLSYVSINENGVYTSYSYALHSQYSADYMYTVHLYL